MILTGGNVHDVTQLLPLVHAIPPIRGKRGRPRQRPDTVFGDRAYDSAEHHKALRRRGIIPVLARNAPRTAPDWAPSAGSWNAATPGYTSSADYGSDGNAEPTSTKHS